MATGRVRRPVPNLESTVGSDLAVELADGDGRFYEGHPPWCHQCNAGLLHEPWEIDDERRPVAS